MVVAGGVKVNSQISRVIVVVVEVAEARAAHPTSTAHRSSRSTSDRSWATNVAAMRVALRKQHLRTLDDSWQGACCLSEMPSAAAPLASDRYACEIAVAGTPSGLQPASLAVWSGSAATVQSSNSLSSLRHAVYLNLALKQEAPSLLAYPLRSLMCFLACAMCRDAMPAGRVSSRWQQGPGAAFPGRRQRHPPRAGYRRRAGGCK
jgi:hypothetical protein